MLFLDVVGSTALAQHLGPEDIHAVLDRVLTRCTAIVEAHRGKVLLGGGVDAAGSIRGIAVSIAARMEQSAPVGGLPVVTVVGDAGVGKSRLLSEFQGWAEARPEVFYLFQGRADPQTRSQPHGLLRDIIAHRFRSPPATPWRRPRTRLCMACSRGSRAMNPLTAMRGMRTPQIQRWPRRTPTCSGT